jgi:hypothetical protein
MEINLLLTSLKPINYRAVTGINDSLSSLFIIIFLLLQSWRI